MKKLILLIGLVSSFLGAKAQVDVVNNQTAQALAQTLAGQGVIILNPTLNCNSLANGKFRVISSNLGIDSGIVLSSGRALSVGPGQYGVNGVPGDFASNSFGMPGDAQLTTLINSNTGGTTPTKDACILEFDFIPAGDTIKFDYVLGSDEYTTFNCSINDVFGFFISGPGIPTPRNIALVPGTTNTMVGISTVNDGTNSSNPCFLNTFGVGPYTQYYVNNTGVSTSLTYNGMTQVFTAISSVTPCETYHLKLAIADAQDEYYDSGVFLKAGSLNSVGIVLSPESTSGADTPDPHCIRGCKSGHIGFSRPAPRPTPLTIKYLIQGTAVNGVDYQHIIDSVVIPANQTTAELEIKPYLVQYATGPVSVIIKALSPYSCGTTGAINVIDSATIWIYDSLFVNIPTPPITVCPRTEITITADIDPTLNYFWTPAALIPDPLPLGLSIHPKPTVPTSYTITVSQPGAPSTCQSVKRTYFANVEPIPQVVLPSRDTTICWNDSIDLSVRANPNGLNYTYNWAPASYLRDDHSANNKFFAPVGDYKYVITAITPVAHCANKDSFNIHVVPPFVFESVTPVDTTIKYGDGIKLSSESEAIYWIWDPITYLDDPMAREPIATPLKDMVYKLVGINQYGCTASALVDIKVKFDPNTGMPNAFSPNGDGVNDVFKIENLAFEKMTQFKVFNRWGKCVYDGLNPARGWDGTYNNKPAPVDVYYYHIKLTMPGGVQKDFKGDVTLLR
jgi:gliding motility-associated-like protein